MLCRQTASYYTTGTTGNADRAIVEAPLNAITARRKGEKDASGAETNSFATEVCVNSDRLGTGYQVGKRDAQKLQGLGRPNRTGIAAGKRRKMKERVKEGEKKQSQQRSPSQTRIKFFGHPSNKISTRNTISVPEDGSRADEKDTFALCHKARKKKVCPLRLYGRCFFNLRKGEGTAKNEGGSCWRFSRSVCVPWRRSTPPRLHFAFPRDAVPAFRRDRGCLLCGGEIVLTLSRTV